MKGRNCYYLLAGCFAGLLGVLPAAAQNNYTYAVNKQHAPGYVFQGTQESKQSLSHVLKELNKLKGVFFLYSDETIGNLQVNPVKDLRGDVEKTLTEILKNTGLRFKKISDNTYVITAAKEKRTKTSFNLAPQTNHDGAAGTKVVMADPVRGRITSPDGTPLLGVSVSVKGSNRGTTTNANGEFILEANKGDVIVISYVGYQQQEVLVDDRQNFSITLSQGNQQISEVVVTALGIRKSRRALGYAVTEVNGAELTKAREVNVANSLVGRVPGVNVSSVSGGPGSSANVIIRGISSLTGDNQPLYVVNGIPITNRTAGNNGGQYTNAPDLGDGIQNINPDDIETISVLKGAAASALYGSRAKHGVILITTKSGQGNGTVEFNSNYVADRIIDVTDWQYTYGSGANGLKPATMAAAFDAGNSSWGARLDGSSVIQFDGVARPYVAHKDNLKDFYRTGNTFTNTLSFGRGYEGGNFRFSASALNNQSPVPNSGLDRYSFNFSGNFNVTKRLVFDARVNFVHDNAQNRPILADGAGNANFQAMFLPTSVDIKTLAPGTKADGSELAFTNNTFATNPWFAANKFINNTDRNRLIGSVSARYNFDNGMFAQVRAGRDFYHDRYTTVVPTGAGYYAQAGRHIGEQFNRVSELNADVLIGMPLKLQQNITFTPSIGGNIMKARAEGTEESGTNFAVPYVYNILNAQNKSIAYTDFRQEIQSLYGTLELDYKGFLYLNASGRNDWFSILAPSEDVDIFYPSVSGSFVFSEFWKPAGLTFGKLRAGWANVGSASSIGPYQTLLNYGLFAQQLGGMPLGNITNATIPNSKLQPSTASELEIGTELRFLQNRFIVDLAWYNKKSKNEIVPAPASITTGYTGVVLNIGELQNKGFEMLLSAVPVRTSGFSWTTSLNGSVNDNKVLTLAEGQSTLAVATSRTGNGFIQNIVGEAAYQVMGFDYRYDNAGKIVLSASGIPERGNLIPLGSAYQKYTGGWNNEFTLGPVNFGFLIDGKFGGKVFSATDYYGYFFGLHKETLVNREGTFGTGLSAQNYYTTLATNVSKMFVYDASFIKLRQMTLSYQIPATIFRNQIKGVSISLVGRNLAILMKKTDNIDPEASYAGATQGLELGGVPPVRSYGVNLNVKF